MKVRLLLQRDLFTIEKVAVFEKDLDYDEDGNLVLMMDEQRLELTIAVLARMVGAKVVYKDGAELDLSV